MIEIYILITNENIVEFYLTVFFQGIPQNKDRIIYYVKFCANARVGKEDFIPGVF